MKSFTALAFTLSLLLLLTGKSSAAEEQPSFLVQVSPRSCTHGLYSQPNNGPFSVFVFCDDAGGVNIGVILTEPGAGPGKLKLEGTKTWDKWYNTDRFWQDAAWAADVTSFAWSPTFRYLYVASSAIYGQGSVYKFDLKNRTSIELADDKYGELSELVKEKGIFKVTIRDFDTITEEMILEVILRSSGNKPYIIKTLKLSKSLTTRCNRPHKRGG